MVDKKFVCSVSVKPNFAVRSAFEEPVEMHFKICVNEPRDWRISFNYCPVHVCVLQNVVHDQSWSSSFMIHNELLWALHVSLNERACPAKTATYQDPEDPWVSRQ
jgi:hypothetical protein